MLLQHPRNDLGSKSVLWDNAFDSADISELNVTCTLCTESVCMMTVCSCQKHSTTSAKCHVLLRKQFFQLFAHLEAKHEEKYTQLWKKEQAEINRTMNTTNKLKQTTIVTTPTVCNIPTMRAHDDLVFDAVCKYIVMTHESFECVEGEEFRDLLLHKCGYLLAQFAVCTHHCHLCSYSAVFGAKRVKDFVMAKREEVKKKVADGFFSCLFEHPEQRV